MSKKSKRSKADSSRTNTGAVPIDLPKRTSTRKKRALDEDNLSTGINNRICDLLKKRSLLSSVVVNIIALATIYLCFAPYFKTNDDPGMMLLSAGLCRTPESSSYLIYTNIIIGLLLQFLYSINIDFPWYGCYLISGLFISHVVFLFLALEKYPQFTTLIVYVLYLLTIGINLFRGLQFTISSTLLGLAGLALFVFTNIPKVDEKSPVSLNTLMSRRQVVGLLIVVFGCLSRDMSAALAFLLFIPIIVIRLAHRITHTHSIKTIIAAGAVVFCCFGVTQFDRYSYNTNDDQKGIREWIPLLGQLLNYSALSRVSDDERNKRIADVGWSVNDYTMLKYWFYMDDKLFSTENFRKVLHDVPSANIDISIRTAMTLLKNILFNYHTKSCLLLFLFLSILVPLRRQTVLISMVAMTSVIILILYMICFLKPTPERVFFPMFTFISLLPIISGETTGSMKFMNYKGIRKLVLVVVLVATVVPVKASIIQHRNDSESKRNKSAWFGHLVNQWQPGKDQLFLVWPGSIPWEFISPFGKLRFLENLNAPHAQCYPFNKRLLASFDIDDVHMALAKRDDVFLLVKNTKLTKAKISIYRRYMFEHHRVIIEADRVQNHRYFGIYKIRITESG